MINCNESYDEKILKYEKFIDEQLKPDLATVLRLRDEIYSEHAEFIALKNSISAIEAANFAPGEVLKTRVDIGCNFYVHAHVSDPSRIFIDVGLGFFVEFSFKEAKEFIAKKTNSLDEKASKLTKESSKLKASITLAMQGIKELNNLSQKFSKPN